MKNFILGAIVVAILGGAGYAVAAGSDMSTVDRFAPFGGLDLVKVYDKSNNVVCYIYQGTGISCLKNTVTGTTETPTTKLSF